MPEQPHPLSMCKCVCVCVCRKLTKAKAGTAKTDAKKEEKPKGAFLFDTKPPTPKLLKVFGRLKKH